MRHITNTLRCLSFGLLMGLSTVSAAQENAGDIKIVVEQPWARASIGTSRPGGAYLALRNEGDVPVYLVGLRADISAMPSIHETQTNDEGVSRMLPAGDIEIPVGGTLALEPGSYHIMLMKLQSPLVEGETFPMTLLFSDGLEKEVVVPVLRIGARGPEG